jgi:hypothetical protein
MARVVEKEITKRNVTEKKKINEYCNRKSNSETP